MKLNKYKSLLLIILFAAPIFSFVWNGSDLLNNQVNNLPSVPTSSKDQISTTSSSSNYEPSNQLSVPQEWVQSPQRLSYSKPNLAVKARGIVRPSIQATNYTPHDPIIITSNDDFGPNGYDFPGSGDILAPYRIEYLNITNSSSHLISIRDTDVYFKIDDNLLNGINGVFNGIYLVNVTNGLINNNSVKFTSYGIYLDDSHRNDLILNRVYNNSNNGIWLRYSTNNLLENNTAYFNGNGISFTSSSNNAITFNDLFDNSKQGIAFHDSHYNTIFDNTVEYNGWRGILLSLSNHNQIKWNTVFGNIQEGIWLSNANSSNVDSNSVSQSGLDGIRVDVSSSAVIIASNQITNNANRGIHAQSVSNVSISFNTISWNDAQGISVWNSNEVTIEYNLVTDSWGSGIIVINSSPISILYNDVYRNVRVYLVNQSISGSGITVVSSSGVVLDNYAANNHDYGMLFSNGVGIDIVNNFVELNSRSGIYFEYYNESRILSNQIGANIINGLVLNSSHHNHIAYNLIGRNGANGIFVENSHDNYFQENEIFGNSGTSSNPVNHLAHLSIQGPTTGHGIFLDPSYRNDIFNNTIYVNTGSGIYLLGSEDTSIDHNNVFENQENGVFLENSNNNEIVRNDIFLNGDFNSELTPMEDGILFRVHGPTTGHGIFLDPSDNNIISENNVFDNQGNGVSLQESDASLISDNSIFGNANGVYLENSSYNNISTNAVFTNGLSVVTGYNPNVDFSILGPTTGHGIFLDPSDYNILEGNNVYDNVNNGIYILDSDSTKIIYNILSVNGLYGVQIDFTSSQSVVSYNDFHQNNFGEGSQASDDGLENIFDGNYWSDLPFGVDGYYIDGESNNVDYNPSKTPLNSPEYNFSGPRILYPNGGEKLSGWVTVSWTRVNSDSTPPEEIQYWLFHSDNNGESWNNIPLLEYSTEFLPDGTPYIAFEWDTTTVNNGDGHLLKVVGVDILGFTGSDTSDSTFVIDNPALTSTTTTTTTTTTGTLTPGWTLLVSLSSIVLILGIKRRKNK
ncbi:MAG: right-handed parallel beta-helix repeat-containing protein [Candidatus Hodarchaeales archaeon]